MASLTIDYLDKDGAEMLARKVRQFWAKRDEYPIVTVSPVYLSQSPEAAERPIWCVRSNLVAGKPQ